VIINILTNASHYSEFVVMYNPEYVCVFEFPPSHRRRGAGKGLSSIRLCMWVRAFNHKNFATEMAAT